MAQSVRKRFRGHIERIDELLRTSPTFQEVCADHEELCNLLRERCQTNLCDYARELVEELETEILDYVEEKRDLLD
jgi:hypothetical protein